MKIIKVVLVIAFTILLLVCARYFFFSKTKFACAKFIGIHTVRNVKYMGFQFVVNGSVYKAHISKGETKLDIKRMDCVKVEYSQYWPAVNKVVDIRIVR